MSHRPSDVTKCRNRPKNDLKKMYLNENERHNKYAKKWVPGAKRRKMFLVRITLVTTLRTCVIVQS